MDDGSSGSWIVALGWPAIIVAALLFGYATFRQSITLALLASVIALPMFLYLGFMPGLAIWAAAAYLLLITGAVRIRKHSRALTGAMVTPAALFLLWIAVRVIQQ